MRPDLVTKALRTLLPGAQFSVNADGSVKEVRDDKGRPAPSEQQIASAIRVLEAKENRQTVSSEHEKRLVEGFLVNGKEIRCDDQALLRMGGVLSVLSLPNAPSTQTFPTHAGDIWNVNKVQAEKIYTTMLTYASALFEKSASLQEEIPEDPTDDSHWPARPNIEV